MRICGILTVIAVVMISGCTLGRQPPQGNTSSIATPIPTFTPAPRPTQTPVPVTNLSVARAEQIVLEAVRLCAEQLGDGSDAPIITSFTTMYDAKAGDWHIAAFSGMRNLASACGMYRILVGISPLWMRWPARSLRLISIAADPVFSSPGA